MHICIKPPWRPKGSGEQRRRDLSKAVPGWDLRGTNVAAPLSISLNVAAPLSISLTYVQQEGTRLPLTWCVFLYVYLW